MPFAKTEGLLAIKSQPDLWNGLPESIKAKFNAAVSEKERIAALNLHIKDLDAKVWQLHKNVENKRARITNASKKLDAWEEIDLIAREPKLQKLGESCFHKLVEAINVGEVILPVEDKEALKDDFRWTPMPTAMVFVIQHDWGAAFQNAKDFDEGGQIRLPYDDAIFEFRISGHRVCCCVGAEDGVAAGFLFYIQTSVGWALAGYNTIENGEWSYHTEQTEICANIFNLIRLQVRAICIALDAEVAVTEIVRAPYKLNRKREKAGKIAIYDHHVVSLASRKKYPVLVETAEDEHAKKRLHFVRGHWRHLPAHKVWIKWHLRGNPDLGFIEKEYRL